MKRKNYAYLILFITLTIVATIGLQVYWNIKNYEENKARLITEVQSALDNSIEYYYVEYLKDNIVAFVNNDNSMDSDQFFKSVEKDAALKESPFWKAKNKKKRSVLKSDSVKTATIVNIKINSDGKASPEALDSIQKQLENDLVVDNATDKDAKVTLNTIKPSSVKTISVFKGQKDADSVMALKNLANKIVLSMMQDTIEFKALSTAFEKELKRKNIAIDYKLQHLKCDTLYNSYQPTKNIPLTLSSVSKSAYLPKKEAIKILFSNPIVLVLQRSQTEILLSFLLSVSIISCLLYLLRTINKQKKIDEIKNDLISNITHEFKTPITTIGSALEGIKNFNAENDVEKTNRYLAISGNQLKKLEVMVERLLETASLETDQLTLKKEQTDLLSVLTNCIEKHQLNFPDKTITLETKSTELFMPIDVFHIENALSNIIDNAVKYGGTQIKVGLTTHKNNIHILVEDNGIGMDKSHKEKIFEKFYRIPKGNIHNVKGFGIGLYYSKKIIEKHGGSIELISNASPTLFKITLPNDY